MKRFLTCTAAAALLAAPAHAELDDASYEWGFSAGASSTSCIHYAGGDISRATFVQDMVRARKPHKKSRADFLIEIFEMGMTDPENSPAAKRAFKRCYGASRHMLTTPVHYGTDL